MKNSIISSFILLGIVLVFSCKNKNTEPKPNDNNVYLPCVQNFFLEIKTPNFIEDTYVFGYNGGNTTSFGSENMLNVGSWRAVEDVSGTFYDNIIYLKFDYSQLPSSAVVNGAFITLSVDSFGYSAIPKYVPYGHSIDDDTKSIVISNVTSNWYEASLNYFNQPTENSLKAETYSITTNEFQEYTFNVTKLLQDQLKKGNNGFKIALANPSGNNLLRFASSENAYATYCPKITISYQTPNQ